jgi:hypothetical protein
LALGNILSPPDASYETVDWQRFISGTKKRDFDPVRFFRWRNYWAYGTGIPGDLFVHLFSGLQYIYLRLALKE